MNSVIILIKKDNQIKFIFLLTLITVFLNANSFYQSKKVLLKKVYFDNQFTFYCSNPYVIKQVKGKEKSLIIQNPKYYTPRNLYYKSGKPNERAKRLEWEHVMPTHNFGQHLPCWRSGGRKACKNDITFNEMEADMHNLVPSIGEINADRSNNKFGANIPKLGQYGKCNFEVDFKAKRAYIKDEIKGDIARIYFYMSDRYNINLSKQERKIMEVWNKLDPVDEWERVKNKRVLRLEW